ncbi:Guanine nucleotide-binding protein-like 3 [Liparis tanakae]|uniref:Guanine nucleotide-binding protein-like 3 n=1 Tax=Liparis tanakae TaxID=230148 RepID=A0A4Z2EIM0_9TELE|nr:Guanine nucleotide-binding protein-like 3 [Liparis tanakae]
MSYHCKVPENKAPENPDKTPENPDTTPENPDTTPENPGLPADSATQSGWDLNLLKKGNEETLKGVKFPSQASSIGFVSKGPTAGLLGGVSEVTPAERNAEPLQKADETEEPEETEELEEPQPLKRAKGRVQFQSVSAVGEDDAYDFNTDFK